MPVEVKIPSSGESISEVQLGPWHKSSGDWVEKDDILVEIESDKATLELPAEESGLLKVTEQEGAELGVGDVIGTIDPDAEKPEKQEKEQAEASAEQEHKQREDKEASSSNVAVSKSQTAEAADRKPADIPTANGRAVATSLARKVAEERGVNLTSLQGTGPSGRITKEDVLSAAESATKVDGKVLEKTQQREADKRLPPADGSRGSHREKMTKLRRRIAERLVDAQHNAAMLTTFNEVDMSEVIRLRKTHKETFEKSHGVGLGFMSFFVKACDSALQAFPRVNAYIVDNEIEYHDFHDVSIAVGTEKGLVVPVLRNVETMSFADIERAIRELAEKARDGKLSIEEMTGGTFTITNGGVYGSLNSTPILNPPQSAILGMHAFKNRPIEDPGTPGQIVLRPMMYLAVSYDHRIIDGEQAVKFLVHIKNAIEKPERMLLGI